MREKNWRPEVGEVSCYTSRPNEPYRVMEIGWSGGTILLDPLSDNCRNPSHWAYLSDLEEYKGNLGSWDSEAV